MLNLKRPHTGYGYEPDFKRLTGSTNAAILLSEVMRLYQENGCKPFYRFRTPCNHELYKGKESWTEVLGFTPEEFDSALKRIGTKVTRGTSKNVLKTVNPGDGLQQLVGRMVLYYTTGANIDGQYYTGNVTWYELNIAVCEQIGVLIPEYGWELSEDQE